MIITASDSKNHQLFAFLPKINAKKCGINSSSPSDMKILTKRNEKQTISLIGNNSLRFKEGRPEERAYDACYYEI